MTSVEQCQKTRTVPLRRRKEQFRRPILLACDTPRCPPGPELFPSRTAGSTLLVYIPGLTC
eukprot:3094874-Prymnesium_polylepis.1